MSTSSRFSTSITIPGLITPCQSVGAHLSAKLDSFCTDERTLTDELCDMLCIWLSHIKTAPSKGAHSFNISLAKTTPAEETKNGADLELFIHSPLGGKRCLIQAKVLDPVTMKLRCDSKAGWAKLRNQLVSARAQVGSLAFLLVYVPGRLLNGKHYGFSTYEQGFLSTHTGSTEAFFGATLIPVDDLLTANGRWCSQKYKVPQLAPGSFKNGIPFWKFLIELLLCRRGKWSAVTDELTTHEVLAFRRLIVDGQENPREKWVAFQSMADQWLNINSDDLDRENDA